MNRGAFERTLKDIKLLSSLKSGVIEQFEEKADWCIWQPGKVIVEQGEPDGSVYFLTRGVARVVLYSPQGKIVAFRDILAGEVFGEFSALDGKGRSATVEALQTCVTAKITSEDLWRLIEQNPQFARAIIINLVRRLREMTDRIYEFSALAVNNRIHVELMRLASRSPDNNKIAVIGNVPTHAEIALRISSHREAVSREMSRLQRIGLLVREQNVLVIPDMEKFWRLVDAEDPELLIGK
jgi:CRP/FNR family cyclic AMP-dependent transcriptional regulator